MSPNILLLSTGIANFALMKEKGHNFIPRRRNNKAIPISTEVYNNHALELEAIECMFEGALKAHQRKWANTVSPPAGLITT